MADGKDETTQDSTATAGNEPEFADASPQGDQEQVESDEPQVGADEPETVERSADDVEGDVVEAFEAFEADEAEADDVEADEAEADASNDSEGDDAEAEPVAPKRSVAPIPILSTPPANPLAPLDEQTAVNDLYTEAALAETENDADNEPEPDVQDPSDSADVEATEADSVVAGTQTSSGAVEPETESIQNPESGLGSAEETVSPEEASVPGKSPTLEETQVLEEASAPEKAPALEETQVLSASVPSANMPAPAVAPVVAPASTSNGPRAPFIAAKSQTGPQIGVPPEKTSPLDHFEEHKQGRGWVKGLVATGVTVLVLAGAYAGAQYYFADNIAKGVTVAGVDVGGLTEPQAVERLEELLTPVLAKDMPLSSGELSAVLVPADAGVTFDAQATVAGTTGFSWDPQRLWTHLSGGEELEPVIQVEQDVFTQAIDSVAGSLLIEPVNGTVSFVDGQAVSTKAEDGSSVDVTTAREKVVTNLFTTVRPVPLTTTVTEPEITQAKTDEAFAQAQKIASAAVTVKVGDKKAEIPQQDFTKHIVVDASNGAITFTYAGEDLVEEVLKRTQNLLTDAKDARFEFKNGKPVIVPGIAGTTIDPEALATVFAQAAVADTRVAEIALTESDPEQSTEALEKLGIKEVVASFSTPLPGGALRTENLRVAASRVTGTLVKPGEEFDLTKVIGPISKANGYHDAGVIVNGVHTEGVGGGLSQMSTTTYNAGFFAGMTDIAHRPHSVWFQRYPAGRESTLFVGSINMVWRNDSPTGILMRSYVANGKVTVEAWGTKTYEVTTSTSPHRNVVKAQVTTSTASDCVAYGKGEDGFTVTVTRKVRELATNKVVKDEANTWTYRPDNGVSCKKKETPSTQDADKTESTD